MRKFQIKIPTYAISLTSCIVHADPQALSPLLNLPIAEDPKLSIVMNGQLPQVEQYEVGNATIGQKPVSMASPLELMTNQSAWGLRTRSIRQQNVNTITTVRACAWTVILSVNRDPLSTTTLHIAFD